jgi:Ca2+/H+ antiporter
MKLKIPHINFKPDEKDKTFLIVFGLVIILNYCMIFAAKMILTKLDTPTGNVVYALVTTIIGLILVIFIYNQD